MLEELRYWQKDLLSSLYGIQFFLTDIITGGILTLVILLIFRYVFRAILHSWLGKYGGHVATLLEVFWVVIVILKTYQNPGSVAVATLWCASLARVLLKS
ncbi:hypothetical protein JCM39194_25430 [Desulfotomaculum varum]